MTADKRGDAFFALFLTATSEKMQTAAIRLWFATQKKKNKKKKEEEKKKKEEKEEEKDTVKKKPFEIKKNERNVALVVHNPDDPLVVKVVEDALTVLGETGYVTNILEVNDTSTCVIHLFCSNPETVRTELNRLLVISMKITKKA